MNSAPISVTVMALIVLLLQRDHDGLHATGCVPIPATSEGVVDSIHGSAARSPLVELRAR